MTSFDQCAPLTRSGDIDRMSDMLVRYLGPVIVRAFTDDDVTEVYVNPQDSMIRFDTRSRGRVETGERIAPARVEMFLNAVASSAGATIGANHPLLEAELPSAVFRGSRLQGFVPPVVKAPAFTVRKPPTVIYSLDDLFAQEDKATDESAHWNDEARALLAGVTLHVAASAPAELRTPTHLRELITLPPDRFAELLAEMSASTAAGGLVARTAARLLQKAEKERSGVISSAQRHTHFLDSPRMARVMGRSTIDLAELKRGRPSFYLVLPRERVSTYRRWLRLMLGCCLIVLTRTREPPRERVCILLDEFTRFGRLQPVEESIGDVAGFGASFWLLVQDLARLKAIYPDTWETFLANADVVQAFGVSDLSTAKHLSELTGQATIHVASQNRSAAISRGRHPSRQHAAAETMSEAGRYLLTPDEVRRLDPRAQLLFPRGSAPVLAERLDYRRDPAYAGQADPNPMYAQPTTRAGEGES